MKSKGNFRYYIGGTIRENNKNREEMKDSESALNLRQAFVQSDSDHHEKYMHDR